MVIVLFMYSINYLKYPSYGNYTVYCHTSINYLNYPYGNYPSISIQVFPLHYTNLTIFVNTPSYMFNVYSVLLNYSNQYYRRLYRKHWHIRYTCEHWSWGHYLSN